MRLAAPRRSGGSAGDGALAPPPWLAYLLAGLIPLALGPVVLRSQWGQTGLTFGVGWCSALVCLWRWRTRRGTPSAWLWIGAGLAFNCTGSLWEAVQTEVFSSTATPSGADAFYLALYPCVSIGLLIVVRSRHPELGLAKLLDAGTLTVGLGLLCWVFLITPAARESGSLLAHIVSIAYPVGDLMLLAILARVMAAEGWRTATIRLLLGGLLCFLLGDSAWAVVNDNGWSTSEAVGALLGDPFLLAYLALGAAALHPSARSLDARAAEPERISRVLLAALTVTSLIAPAILAGQAIAGEVTDGVAIAVCSAQLTGLVAARMSLLLRALQRQSARLRELALEDALTGLPNRRALQSFLGDAIQRARRDRQPLSVAMIDLDLFKRFNDEFGHPAGDHLLKAAASAWRSRLRATDLLARIGGEEFVVVLPGASLEQAHQLIGELSIATPLGQTFSAGVAEWDALALPEELLSSADAAMYGAKRAGRNRIELAAAPAAG